MTIALDNQHDVRRFLTKTRWGGGPDGDCLEWIASLILKGYGQFWSRSKNALAHRVAWEWKHGLIPDGLFIDHMCRNRKCVNVEHLRLVTPRKSALENSESFVAVNAMKTHCIHGHEFNDKNTYVYTTNKKFNSERRCRICRNDAAKRYRQRNKDKVAQ